MGGGLTLSQLSSGKGQEKKQHLPGQSRRRGSGNNMILSGFHHTYKPRVHKHDIKRNDSQAELTHPTSIFYIFLSFLVFGQ